LAFSEETTMTNRIAASRVRFTAGILATLLGSAPVRSDEPSNGAVAPSLEGQQAVPALPPASSIPGANAFPINLPTALQLAGVEPLDIAVAAERLRIACAQLDRARVLWLPHVNFGVDYFRHDGRIQDVEGRVFETNKSSAFGGVGPSASFAVTDALYAPLANRQVVRAREADVQASRNNSMLAVAEAYFSVQQARGEAAGSDAAVRRALDLVRRAERLAPALVPTVEISRARAELVRRRQQVESANERWQTASAELVRLLRLDPTTVVVPQEAAHLQVELIDSAAEVDQLIPIGLTHRPELAANQALVQATLVRLRQEKMRPLVPSLVVRGVGSATPGLSTGAFGGGINDFIGNSGPRNSVDVQLVWELQNLGLGNRAAVRERDAERRIAMLELLRTQDRIAAEIAQSRARVQRARNRMKEAEEGVQSAVESADRNLQGLGQTKRVGEQVTLMFRPQEAVAAVAALDQAYRDYYSAVADGNRAQFALYRALGRPADAVLGTMLENEGLTHTPNSSAATAPMMRNVVVVAEPDGPPPGAPQAPGLPDGDGAERR
jgi:outer membrane protein TolC